MGESMYFKKKSSSLPASTPASKGVSWRRPFPEQNTHIQSKSDDKDEQAYQRRPPSNAMSRLDSSLDLPRAMKPIQTKLTVGAPGDQYEQEADRVADKVMSMPDAAIQQSVWREAAPEEEELQTKPIADSITPLVQREEMPEEEEVQTKLLGSIQREEMPEEEEPVQAKPSLQRSPDGSLQAGGNLESRLNSSKGGGSALPDEVRSFMEPRFGADFSQVRVHTGGEALQMNRDLNAQAFTHKHDVYFGAGKSPAKDALTAHELTHVVQQRGVIQTEPTVNRLESENEVIQPSLLGGIFGGIGGAAGGALIGGAVGGPIGALVGGAVGLIGGGLLGDELTDDKKQSSDQEQPPSTSSSAQKAQALKILEPDTTGSWKNLPSWDVVKRGAKQRVNDPSLINQKYTNLCGPAAILHAMAETDPVQYAIFVRAIFTDAKIFGTKVDDDLLKAQPLPDMDPSDWMVLSAMRDTENAIFDFEGTKEEDLAALTTPGDMSAWMKKLLGCVKTAHYRSYVFGGETSNANKVSSLLSKYGNKIIVAMLVDSAKLQHLKKGLNIPDHWIRLLSIDVQENIICFVAYTWGSENIYFFKKDSSNEVDFEDVIFEFTIGTKDQSIEL